MRVIVGRIGRPHGIRGEVVIGVRTDEPDLRFAVGAVLDFEPTLSAGTSPGAGPAPNGDGQLTVEAARWHSGQLLVAFDGITDRTAAGEPDRRLAERRREPAAAPADPDEFRDHDLIGLRCGQRTASRWAWSPTCCITARTCS